MASRSSSRHATYHQSYLSRSTLPSTPQLSSYLLCLMAAKQTNLCLSADVQWTSQLLDLAEECGDSICVFKTHADIVLDFGEKTIKGLTEIAARKRFLLFEDRKFGDIGNTVQTQYAAGTHRIGQWASLTNAHIFPGPAIIPALKSASNSALAASNSRISTEITGGPGPLSPGLPKQEDFTVKRRSFYKESDEDDSSQDDDETTTGPASPHEGRDGLHGGIYMDSNARKGSVVSVSTTISSSKEYISPPAPASPTSTASISPSAAAAALPVNAPLTRGLLLLAQMSSQDNMLTPAYTQKCLEQARQHRDFVLGFIAQESLNRQSEDNFVVLTPGVSLPSPSSEDTAKRPTLSRNSSARSGLSNSKGTPSRSSSSSSATGNAPEPKAARASSAHRREDNLGQQYNTPRHAILDQGVDIIIVGRGILNADDRGAEAKRYRKEGWAAYLERVGVAETTARKLANTPASSRSRGAGSSQGR